MIIGQLEVWGPSGPWLLGCGPSGLLDNVLHALWVLRPCDPRINAMMGQWFCHQRIYDTTLGSRDPLHTKKRFQIVHGVKLTGFKLYSVKLSGVKLSTVSNFPGVKMTAVSNCPVSIIVIIISIIIISIIMMKIWIFAQGAPKRWQARRLNCIYELEKK